MNCDTWLIERYEKIAQISSQMLQLARSGQWNELPLQEQKRVAIVTELKSGVCSGVTLGDGPSRKLADLIGAILKADAETQSLAESWRGELQGLLGSMNTERKLLDAYGN
ncbi:hypothetical protein SKTS_18340 [Sulfurimicrobium lacus]|uniref:Flagellar protein FliT n=1 Tax=Sulfurimicrobium lacus TaxID=2715678 RepID=A0A6F8VB59_9PROT|nr:flagellar protein FliT [Sulfurimicrobium lacus]BCB26948.1 hypothetical protein SKTS_18340 [Sulfurimicrobium lacus]